MNEYSENELVRDSAASLLESLGWANVFAHHSETFGADGTLGRHDEHEVVLTRYLTAALRRLNPWLTVAQTGSVVATLTHVLSTDSPLATNERIYYLLRDGVPVTVTRPDGRHETRLAQVIDLRDPSRNHFLAVRELRIAGTLYHRRTDIVGFVNGIPLLFIELKGTNVPVENAYTDNYRDYQTTIPQLFYYNALLVLSNGLAARVGTLGSPWAFFHEWKRLAEDETGSVALETLLRGICRPESFLDILENFIVYDHSSGTTAKILARNHQYLGVNAAFAAYRERELTAGRLGVFWHTQGSGKSYSMVFLAQKIRRFFGGTTIVVLTDRDELNRQISETFAGCGLLSGPSSQAVATSGADLYARLRGNPSFVFTLIQKFNDDSATPITPEHDILIMSDEAHRSQYGVFAANMARLLPTASRIGFTGTPLLAGDLTARTFGGYVSVYDFRRAVEDGATVPLYYENRGERLADLHNPAITDEILDAIERADLSPDEMERVEQEFRREIHLLTAEPRLRSIARDIAHHYAELFASGKAMVVCLNKVTCVRMYNYVQEYWAEEIAALEERIGNPAYSQQESLELARRVERMRETQMAVVVSQEQNEQQTFAKWGLDITYHREQMVKRELDKEFKDPASPLRIVFVCAMWLTGFDVKCLSCLYLDKPLKAHTLMQTIARANRVAEGKSNGLIIDYIGLVKALRQALADYTTTGAGTGAEDPTIDKAELVARIGDIATRTQEFLGEIGFDLAALIAAEAFAKIRLLADGANAICSSQATKKKFSTYAAELGRLMKFVTHDDLADATRAACLAIAALYRQLRQARRHIDTTDLMVEINAIISEHVAVDTSLLHETAESRRFDISQIDFDLLGREFARRRHKNLVLRDLEAAIQQKLDALIGTNPTRVDYYERYQAIITAYNSEQDKATIEKTFMDLMHLASELSAEQQRYIREGLASDEELSLYDLLLRSDLSPADIKKLKAVAADLLAKIKDRIAALDHWQEKDETRAIISTLIRDTLWSELPACYDDASIATYQASIYDYAYSHFSHAI